MFAHNQDTTEKLESQLRNEIFDLECQIVARAAAWGEKLLADTLIVNIQETPAGALYQLTDGIACIATFDFNRAVNAAVYNLTMVF